MSKYEGVSHSTLGKQAENLEALLIFCLKKLREHGLGVDDAPEGILIAPYRTPYMKAVDVPLRKWWSMALVILSKEEEEKAKRDADARAVAVILDQLTNGQIEALRNHFVNQEKPKNP